MKSLTSIAYKSLTALMVVMLALTALPVSSAFAATSVLVPWAKAYDQTTGTGAGFNVTVPNGANRIMVVGIAATSTASGTVANPTTITYGGQTLTLATGNGATNGRMHTWLYYLKDNVVMDNTARPLNITMGAGAIVNMTVWYAVYAGVDQAPATYTTGNGFNNTASNGPAQLSANMAVNTSEQAVYISSVYNDTTTALPTYTINANWTSGGTNTGTNAAPIAWRNQVANRTVPATNVTDNAATSNVTYTPASNNSTRYAISAMSLPAAKAISTTAITNAAALSTTATVVGQAYAVNVSVTGAGVTPTGTVTVSDGVSTCTITLAAGIGTCNLISTTVGAPKTITATYAGDATYAGSSNTATHTVNKADTTTAINNAVALGNATVVGQAYAVTYSVAVVAPGAGTPTGNVTVSDGTSNNTCTVAAGTCNLTSTSVGAKTITATYTPGDANFNASLASAGVLHTVNKANTTTTITNAGALATATFVGQAYPINYTVVAAAPGAGTPTGNVTVSDGTATCTATVAAGTCSLTSTSVGNKTITVTYVGDANFNTSTSAGVAHTVSASYTITLITGTGGTIQSPYGTVVTGSVTMGAGTSRTFYFVPNTGFIVKDVKDGGTLGPLNALSINTVGADHTVQVDFDGGWFAPSTNVLPGGSQWTNPANVYTSNNVYATQASNALQTVDYTTFGIPTIPNGSIIDGIEVAVEGYSSGRQVQAELSGNSGGSWTLLSSATGFGATEQTTILTPPTDNLWGIGWAPANFNATPTTFRVRMLSTIGGIGPVVYVDQLQVKVHYREQTTLTVSAAAGTYGGTVNLTGTLNTTTGNNPVSDGQIVTFYLNGVSVGTAATVGGVATLNNVSLAGINANTYVGTYNTSGIGASYAGTIAGVLPGYLPATGVAQLTVNKANLTVTANDQIKTYGNADPVFTFAYSGFQNGDTSAVVDTPPTCTVVPVHVNVTPPTYPITCSGGLDNNYNFTYVNGALTINKRAITVTAATDTKNYDGSTSSTVIPTITGALAFTDTPNFIETFDTKDVGTGKTLTPSGTVNDGNGGNNYAVTFTDNTTGVINPKALTITGITANNKVYDGNTTATLNTGGATLVGVVGTENVVLDTSGAVGTFINANAGNAKAVAISGLIITGTDIGNYTLTQPATTADITSAALDITASSGTMIYGGTVPTITPSYSGLVAGDLAPATVPSCSTTATSTSPVASYVSSCTGAVDSNYTITYTDGTVAVTKAALDITASSSTMIYGGTVPMITPSYSGLVAGDLAPVTVPSCSTTATSTSPVASYVSSCTGAVDSNYTITYTDGTVAVTKAALDITASSGTMIYGGTVPTITPSYSGLVAGDLAPATVPSCSTTATSTSPVASYVSSCTGAVDSNYTITYTDGTVAVTKAALDITASSGTMIYGGTVPMITPSYSGLVAGDLAPATAPSCSTTATSTSPVASYVSSCTGAVDSNYTITYTDGTVAVTKAALDITASSGTMIYGGTVPTITPSYSGLVAGDLAPATVPSCSTTATSTSPVASYVSSCTGAVDSNYTITYTPGTVTVTKATATVSVTGGTFTYDATPHAATGFAYGVGGIADVLTPAVTFSYVGTGGTTYGPIAIAPTSVGTYSVTASFAGNINYLSASDIATIVINPADVTVGVTGGTFPYDATPHAATGFAYGVGGISDVLTPAVTFSYSGTGGTIYGPTAVAPTNAGTYSALASFAGNADYSPASNFAVLTITKRAITVTAVPDNKPYDSTTSSVGVPTITGVLAGTDTPSFIQTFDTSNAGTGKTLTPSGTVNDGNGGNNYTVTFVTNANGVINGITVTVSGITANNKIYDGTTAATLNTAGASLSGVVLGDNVQLDVAGATGSFPDKNVANGKVVTVSGLSLTGLDAANYSIVPYTTTANITTRPITVTAQTNTKVYDRTTNSTAVPAITVGTLAVGDTANFIQTYDTVNVGTSKTLTPSGAVADTNGGGNYVVTFVNNTTGVITSVPITVTATPKAKAFGALDPAFTYSITSGSLVVGDSLSGSLTRAPGETVGAYAILLGSLSAGPNYTLTYVGANLTISIVNQTITVVTPAPANSTFNSNFNVTATASSGLPVSITTTGSTACIGGGSTTATIVMISGVGTCTIHFNQAGDANFGPALEVLETVTPQKANQTISVNTSAPANATYNTGFNVSATATSGLAVTYSSAGVCTNAGSNFTINSGTGTCTVRYDQAGDNNYNAATQVTQTTTAQKANQTISVTTSAPASAAFNSSFTVAANASSGLAVAYTSSGSCANPGTTTYNMNSSTGICSVLLNQAGNANYNAAPQVTQTVNAQKANQTITVTTSAPAGAAFGSNFTVAATSSSGLVVTYTSAGSCTNIGANFTITSSSGSCTVQYNQAGNASYNAAPQVTESTNSLLTNQTITVNTPAPANAAFGSNFTVAATASSGLPVSYSALGSCTNVGADFTMTSSTGTCTVQYNQAGNVNFNAASQVTNTVNAQKADQTITVTTAAPATAANAANFTVAATASSGLPVAYSATGSCTNVGADFTMTGGTGTCTVQYNQSGDANYNAAPQVTQTTTAQKANQTINVMTNAPSSAANGTSFNVAATANSGLPVAITTTGVCIGSGTGSANITINSSSGICTVHYNQAGDANYNSATEVTKDVTALTSSQTISVTTHAPSLVTNGASFNVAATSNSGLTVAITVSGGVCSVVDHGDGTATITITSPAGTCTVHYNQAGNSSYAAASEVTDATTIDSNVPTVTINQASAQADPANVSPINFTVEFSKTVTGFTSSDVTVGGTAGATTATVTGSGSTYNVAVSGMTIDGTVTVSIPANVAKDASNNANAASTSTDNTVMFFDASGPTVQIINTSPETADHVLSNSEIVTFSITQFTVKFNQDVYNPAGDSDPKDVTNPNNYMLVRDLGDTAGLQTVSCSSGAVVPADTKIAVNAVTYDSATYTATFTVNSGLPLSNGDYNLFICGTTSIVDPLNHDLALVGSSGQPNSDYRRSFTINIADNGGGGGGNSTSGNKSVTKPALATGSALIPVTGFKPNAVTILPVQPADKAYKPLDNIRIEIPTLGINFPIVGVLFTNDKWDLTWLKNSVGYLEGSAYPTYSGNTVLTAHVTDANNNLGPFSDIKGMQLGDKILLHAYGQIYVYEVQENTKILPSNISTVFKHEDYNWVTLVTCENYNAKTGLYTYRRMVRAVLVSVVPENK